MAALANRLWNDLSGGAPDNDLSGAGDTLGSINGAALILDLNSDVGVTTLAGAVSQWNDQSARANSVIQNTGSARPTYQANVMDGHAAIRFDGVDDILDAVGTLTGVPAAGSRLFVYCVYDPLFSTTAYDAEMWSLSTDGTEGLNTDVAVYHHSTVFFRIANGVLLNPGADPVGVGPRLAVARFDSPNCQIDYNGVMLGSVAFSGLSHGGGTYLRIAARFDGIYNMNADYFRLAMVVNPSVDQHAAVMAYFKRQYPTLGLP